MSDVSVNIEVNSSDFNAKFSKLISAETQKEILSVIGESVKSRVKAGFRSKTSPYGNNWLPLKFRKGSPLRDTGAFYNSISAKIAGDSVFIGTDKSVEYKGKTHSLGNIHHFGRLIKPIPPNKYLSVPIQKRGKTSYIFIKKSVIPARPFLPIKPNGNADLPSQWQDQMLNAIYKVMNK